MANRGRRQSARPSPPSERISRKGPAPMTDPSANTPRIAVIIASKGRSAVLRQMLPLDALGTQSGCSLRVPL